MTGKFDIHFLWERCAYGADTITSVHALGPRYAVILKEKDADRYLPILVGASDANAIAIKLHNPPGLAQPDPRSSLYSNRCPGRIGAASSYQSGLPRSN